MKELKKLLSVLLAMIMLLACIPLCAVSAEVGGVYGGMTYEIVNDEGVITGYTESLPADLVIPATIEGYPVTKICDFAFEDCDILNSVVISDSVVDLGAGTFGSCKRLTSVIIGDGVSAVRDSAFCDCSALTYLVIGDSVTTIEYCAFDSCSSLPSVVIPDSVTSIGVWAFSDCSSLRSITIGENVNYTTEWTFRGTAYFNDDKNWKNDVLYIGNCLISAKDTLTGCCYIQPGTKTIADMAFMECSEINALFVPESVVYINFDTFLACDTLVDIYYAGTEEDRSNMIVRDGNDPLLNATWHYNCINPKDHYSADVPHSVMDTENGTGLAFKFELSASVNFIKKNKLDLTDATINYLGETCKLVGVGAVVTNQEEIIPNLDNVNGKTVIDIPTVYLTDWELDVCAFAARIVNIPESALDRIIYARPYYIIEVDGEQLVVYGEINSACASAYMA